jgi:hypothetical protein
MRTLAVALVLFTLLGVTVWFVADSWMAVGGPPMPTIGWVVIIGGTVMSLLVGGGLMGLMFYSHRHGYDDIDHRPQKPD